MLELGFPQRNPRFKHRSSVVVYSVGKGRPPPTQTPCSSRGPAAPFNQGARAGIFSRDYRPLRTKSRCFADALAKWLVNIHRGEAISAREFSFALQFCEFPPSKSVVAVRLRLRPAFDHGAFSESIRGATPTSLPTGRASDERSRRSAEAFVSRLSSCPARSRMLLFMPTAHPGGIWASRRARFQVHMTTWRFDYGLSAGNSPPRSHR
jgi:hypothetical protein